MRGPFAALGCNARIASDISQARASIVICLTL
jgi:hypothetical protein